VEIASLDVYSHDGNAFIAFCDSLALNVSPLHLLLGRIRSSGSHVNRVDVELPTVLLHRFMLDHGFLSQPVIEEEPYGVRQYMSFRDVDLDLQSDPDRWSLAARGVCDVPFLKDTSFDVKLARVPASRSLRIEGFSLTGERVVEQRVVKNGRFATDVLRAPLQFDLRGLVATDRIDLSKISLSIGDCYAESRFSSTSNGLAFEINVNGQNIDDLRLLLNTRTHSNTLAGINLHARSRTAPDGSLATDGVLKIAGGAVRDTPFRNASFTFQLSNDRIVAFDSIATVWDGDFHVALNESVAAGDSSPSNRLLLGELAARHIDMRQCLGEFETLPAESGGEMNFDITFDMEHVGVAEFLATRLREFALHNGAGYVTLSNAYLRFFASEQWLLSPQVPELIRNFLGLSANLTAAPRSLPLITKLIKEAGIDAPRTVSARVIIENGTLATPQIFADTPIGRLVAVGHCDEAGDIDYGLAIELSDAIVAQYGDHPLVSLFRHDSTFDVPVRISGSLAQPRVELDLTDQERVEFEERLMALITAYIEQKLASEQAGTTEQAALPKDIEGIEQTVRSLIRKLF
jgi:hypothetical protein